MSDKPLTKEERITKDLIALKATLNALDGLPTNKAKGEYLIDRFEQRPRLVFYFRTAYDKGLFWTPFSGLQPPERWENYVDNLPKELQDIIASINTKELHPALSGSVLNKVFKRTKRERIKKKNLISFEKSKKSALSPLGEGLSIEVTGHGGHGVELADMLFDNIKVASMFLYISPELKKALDVLRSFGIVVNIPSHMKE